MYLTKLLAVFVFGLCVCRGQMSHDSDTDQCMSEIHTCSYNHMTNNHCRTVWGNIQEEVIRSDADNDCWVSREEFNNKIRMYAMAKGDERFCYDDFMAGCKKLWTYEYCQWKANNFQIEKYSCKNDPNVDFSKVSRDDFFNQILNDLKSFCMTDGNSKENRDCFGLNYLLIYLYGKPRYNFLSDYWMYYSATATANGKLEIIRKAALAEGRAEAAWKDEEENPTGTHSFTVRLEQIIALFKQMDNGNTKACISREEMRQSMVNNFTFSEEFSNFLYDMIEDSNSDNCMEPTEIAHSFFGHEESFESYFVSFHLFKYLKDFCDSTEDYYMTHKECWNIGDYCSDWYKDHESCKNFRYDCGVAQYYECVQNNLICSDDEATKMMLFRIDNQRKEFCEANDGFWPEHDHVGASLGQACHAGITIIITTALGVIFM